MSSPVPSNLQFPPEQSSANPFWPAREGGRGSSGNPFASQDQTGYAVETNTNADQEVPRDTGLVPNEAVQLNPVEEILLGGKRDVLAAAAFTGSEAKLERRFRLGSFSSGLSRPGVERTIVLHREEMAKRREFVLKLAKALLSYGAPSHRIESQLIAASDILEAKATFVHLPGIIIATFENEGSRTMQTHFVRAGGKVALTNLQKVHQIYREVLHDELGAEAGTEALRKLMRSPPIYSPRVRCTLAFISASVICILSFGGSVTDMWVSGLCASLLQYLNLNVAAKSALYANVYEISISIIIAFVARGLSTIHGQLFCYSAVSSSGCVLILPGFTVLTSALELTSKNMLCGSVRIVYAVIYTLFLGFGLTIGSDFFLILSSSARRTYYEGSAPKNITLTHGLFTSLNGSSNFIPVSGVLGMGSTVSQSKHIVKGCFRDPAWPWYRQPMPWWSVFFLVPLYSTSSSLSNLQDYRSWQLLVMVAFSCCSYTANRFAAVLLPDRTDIVAASGAMVLGLLGNIYSRLIGGTAFTSMVTGVLFLVPSGIAQGGGLTQTYRSSADQYSSGFSLALRMISVACGVTIGLFVSQVFVYALGRKKNVGLFAF